MVWSNGPLTVYHGTDDAAATSIERTGIRLSVGRGEPDFGPGFYTTTNLHQARHWANQRVRLLAGARAAVLALTLDRTRLGELSHLVFLREIADFWDLVEFSRAGATPLHGRNAPYDVVYGPVSLPRQLAVIKDYDQISFHTPRAIDVLSDMTRLAPLNRLF